VNYPSVSIATYEVWAISRITGEDNEGYVRVTLKNPDYGDTLFTCRKENAPLIGTTVELRWS
jgi:hypothetical protein